MLSDSFFVLFFFFCCCCGWKQTDASTHRGRIRQSYGGVGRNLADGLTRLGGRPLFLTAVGDDRQADDLIRHNAHMVVTNPNDLKFLLAALDYPLWLV